jgi:hypothetical protein
MDDATYRSHAGALVVIHISKQGGLIPAYILQRLASSERCQLDLPGFKNLEGLHIAMFLSTARGSNKVSCSSWRIHNFCVKADDTLD